MNDLSMYKMKFNNKEFLKSVTRYLLLMIASLSTTIALMMHEEMKIDLTQKLQVTLIFVTLLIIYSKFMKNRFQNSKTSLILGFIFALFSYCELTKDNNTEFIYFFKYLKESFMLSMITIMGYTFLYYIIIEGLYYLFNKIRDLKVNVPDRMNRIFNFIFEKHPVLITALIILMLWLPHIIIQYPGAVHWDTDSEIARFLKIDGKVFDAHYPVFHVWLVRNCNLKLSKDFR